MPRKPSPHELLVSGQDGSRDVLFDLVAELQVLSDALQVTDQRVNDDVFGEVRRTVFVKRQGLGGIVRERMQAEPRSRALFVFVGNAVIR